MGLALDYFIQQDNRWQGIGINVKVKQGFECPFVAAWHISALWHMSLIRKKMS